MTPLIKGGVGFLTIGTVAGVGYAGSTYFINNQEKIEPQKKTISKLIEDRFEYILLKKSDSKEDKYWQENWRKYNTENETGQDPFKLEGWTRDSSNDLTSKLKDACEENSKIIDDGLYDNMTKYCSRAVTIEDEAKKDGVIVLKTSETTEDATNWKNKIDKRNELAQHFGNLSITNSDTLSAQHLREKCSAITSKKKQESKYEEIYKSYKAVCTNPK